VVVGTFQPSRGLKPEGLLALRQSDVSDLAGPVGGSDLGREGPRGHPKGFSQPLIGSMLDPSESLEVQQRGRFLAGITHPAF
jgi:hypothetical protein